MLEIRYVFPSQDHAVKKLTLSADADVIEAAHRLAQEQGTSVSAMFSRLVRLLAKRASTSRVAGRITRKATGLIELPPGKDEGEVLAEALAERHGLTR